MGPARILAMGAVALALIAAALFLGLRSSDPAKAPPKAEPPAEAKAPAEARAPAEAKASRKPPPEPRPREPSHRLALTGPGTDVVTVRTGEEVDVHARPGGPVVRTVGATTEFASRRAFSVFETRGEWAGVPTEFTGNDSLGWVKLDRRELRPSSTVREVVVDLSEFRAQLVIAGEVVRTFTVAVGAPGTTTPTGRFAVTDTFRGGLPSAYGCCALALTARQPNLPSGWLGGDRIAIHGTSGPLGQPISSGCVRAADRDVSALVDEVGPGAQVMIRQ
jgi:lipoprotein-anchoring transpeptidase ErfK/SrfK